MICSRRLYKGNSYEICLPLKYSGVTGVNIYTDGAVKIPVTPEISGDTLCFEIASEDLDVLADGVLRYELITDSEVSDSNSRFVVKTPEGYSAQTLDTLLEEAYQSGYTAGGGGGFESGYTSGYTDGYESGYTGGYESGYTDATEDCNMPGTPLTFNITSDGDIVWRAFSDLSSLTSFYQLPIEYNKNNTGWSSITSTAEGVAISVVSGDTVQFRGDNIGYFSGSSGSYFIGTTAGFTLKGNIMSLFNSTDFATMDTIPYQAPVIPLYAMFRDCTGLTDASELLLPATTLARGCYDSMFSGCTNLTAAPALPATTLDRECYQQMFVGCTSLTTAPALPATTLTDNCYSYMFVDCTGLTVAPELPATTLAYGCYYAMFRGCTSLTTAPALPATTLANFCYYEMFSNTSLTEAPELPATALTKACYQKMFSTCRSLTTAPELPATTLAQACYSNMFFGCINLTTAPELPAATLVDNCYNSMFYFCSSLSGITCLATDISASNCTSNWVYRVSSSGTFTKDPNMSSWTTGNMGIPSGWTVQDAS